MGKRGLFVFQTTTSIFAVVTSVRSDRIDKDVTIFRIFSSSWGCSYLGSDRADRIDEDVTIFRILSSSWGNVAFLFSKNQLSSSSYLTLDRSSLSYLPQIVCLCRSVSPVLHGETWTYFFQKRLPSLS